MIRRSLFAIALGLVAQGVVSQGLVAQGVGDDTLRVYERGQQPADRRMGELTDLNGYFPFVVPESVGEWDARAKELRRRVLVATGLWPMPAKTPLNPVVYGKAARPGFTVEKVYLESLPGHYVTGLLFRPDETAPAPPAGQKRAAVLCPHGHGGRLQDYGEQAIRQLIVDGAERFEKSGRFPKLARCAQLARMGCVVFIFDMLGYADSVQISTQLAHRFAKQRPEFEGRDQWGLFSAQAELRLQSIMGIQTWNSIRALDFLEQLPEVDSTRIGVTGGSGGGTQTILLCAIDPRPAAAFPNGMVSTSMQGGCTCENCSLLRIGTGNVELAALFAPKPQAMTAANDWTREMMTKGEPELRQLYALLGAPKNVYCRPLLHFPHNYNYVSRATMYQWFNRHLQLGLPAPIVEEDFEPLTAAEYTVWDDEHPRPAGGDDYERQLVQQLTTQSDAALRKVAPTDERSLPDYRRVVGGAWSTMIGRGLPPAGDIQRTKVDKQTRAGHLYFKDKLRLSSRGEEFPFISLYPVNSQWNGDVVIWLDGAGKRGLFDESGNLRAEARRLLDGGAAVLAADLYLQGEFLPGDKPLAEQRVVKNPREFAGFTFAYNDSLLAQRVHDALTLIAFVKGDEHAPKRIHLLGANGAGPIAAAATAVAGDAVHRTAVDTAGFRFADLTSYRHPDFIPGAVKYGDLPGLLALAAPRPLLLAGERGETPRLVQQAYAAAGKPKAVESTDQQNTLDAAVDWLLK